MALSPNVIRTIEISAEGPSVPGSEETKSGIGILGVLGATLVAQEYPHFHDDTHTFLGRALIHQRIQQGN